MNLAQFERYPLMFGLAPIEKLSRLSEQLGGKVELYAKREDCNSGLAFGGNKEARVPHPRRAGAGLRHARDDYDWRCAVQSHPADGSGGRKTRLEVPVGAGELGTV